MAKASAENERLKAQNVDLNDDIENIKEVMGSFTQTQQSNNTIISQLHVLEKQNAVQARV